MRVLSNLQFDKYFMELENEDISKLVQIFSDMFNEYKLFLPLSEIEETIVDIVRDNLEKIREIDNTYYVNIFETLLDEGLEKIEKRYRLEWNSKM